MYKHLFFLDSKTLDWLTPYILVLASDTIAFNVFVLTFVSVVIFYFLNPMLAFMSIICLYRGITAGEFYQQLIAYIGAILCLLIMLLLIWGLKYYKK